MAPIVSFVREFVRTFYVINLFEYPTRVANTAIRMSSALSVQQDRRLTVIALPLFTHL